MTAARTRLNKVSRPLSAAVLIVALGGCASGEYGQKQTGGALVGGALGGLLGSQIGSGTGQLAATAAGAVFGMLAGSEVGKSLDRADRLYLARTRYSALETVSSGSTAHWSNPDTGHYGSVTPTRTWQLADGRYCRKYQQTVTVGGQYEQAYGTACRQPDGSWQVAN